MKDVVRNLDFYGFDKDCTMYDVNSYPISKVVEVTNEKYVKPEVEEENGDTPSSGDTVVSGDTTESGSTVDNVENNNSGTTVQDGDGDVDDEN